MSPIKYLTCLILTLSLILIQACGGSKVKEKADLVLINGNIATLEESNPAAEAIAVKNKIILAVGSSDEIKKCIGDSTKVINLKSRFLMPGFIESHAHFIHLGTSKQILDLHNAKTWNEVIAIVAKAAAKSKPGDWIIGRGWHQEKFNPKPHPSVNGFPVHNKLSSATPDNPVMLYHASGHAVFANAKAMKMAMINKNSADPAGGLIVRDSEGNPIGVFVENAEILIRSLYESYLAKRSPAQIRAEYIEQIDLAAKECLKKGITSFTDAGEPFDIIDIMKQLADSEKIPVRLNVMVGDSLNLMRTKLKQYYMTGFGGNHLTVRSIKQYIDGALGSRGAWMIEAYADMPGSKGSNVTPLNLLKEISELAISSGFQMCIHAIGDRGNREVLNLYEEIFKEHPDKKDTRWRIEHAQHLSPEDIPRFAKLGVIAAMQGIHCTSDASFVVERLGLKRAGEGAYVWRKLIDNGTTICNGTDAPVEDVDPVRSFYASVTRRSDDGSTFFPDQKMSRTEALKSYTINGAFASFEENLKGSIKVGKLADFVVLSNDLINCPENRLLSTKVLYTIIDGRVLYRAPGF
jgi:predicted amidohydrolase YtcJ